MNNTKIRFVVLTLLLLVFAIVKSYAQDARIQVGHLDRLESKASQVVTVDVPENMLLFASKFLNANKPEEAAVKELVAGLKGVYVKSFEFEHDNEFSQDDVKTITAQLDPARWLKMVDVRSKKEGEQVDVYTYFDHNGKILGIAVLAVANRELTFVNIVGPIDIEKLSQLNGRFHIPSLEIERTTKDKKEDK